LRESPDPEGRPTELPPAWGALDWRPLAPIRNLGKPRVYVAPFAGGRVVCKDASLVRARLIRIYRCRSLRREARALARLEGVPGIPKLLAHWRTGMVMEEVPGRMLTTWPRDSGPPAAAFDALDRIIDLAHARGMVLGDVHRRNILVDEDGGVHLVDFENAVDVSSFPWSLLRGPGMIVDRTAAARQRWRYGLTLSPEQAALIDHPAWTHRIVRRIKRWTQLLRNTRRETR
jgi:predicted Ser/Thr protein kinase